MRSRTILGITFFCLILTGLTTVPPTAVAQSNDQISIRINAKWTGLGGAKESVATAKQVRGKCYLDGKLVDSKLIDALLRELDAPADQASLANLGITQSWLDQNADAAYAAHAGDLPKVDQTKFLATFRNMSELEKLLYYMTRDGWTDDYPAVDVKVERAGRSITLKSKRQNIYMIPFEITENGATRTSYNAKLAQAIAALTPSNFTNRDRLEGDNLRSLVAEKVIMLMRGQIFNEQVGRRSGIAVTRRAW